MTLWRWQELLAALDLTIPEIGPDIQGVSIDSRSLQTGDLFIALSGDPGPGFHTSSENSRNGHSFLGAAEIAGAGALLVSEATDVTLPALTVPDTLKALWQLGQASRKRMNGRVAAITGSAGKTTARYWLEEILRDQASTHASTGSYNNHWGVPLSLARMPATTEYGIFEIGMNQTGEIQPLSELVRPDVAMILNVLPAHIGNLGSIEAIRTEKLSIQYGLLPNGILLVPYDLADFVDDRQSVTFGFDERADIWAEHSGSTALIHIEDREFPLTLSVSGEHRLTTALAVLAMAHTLSADIEAGIAVIQKLGTPPGRGNHIHVAGRTIVDDSYNANPVSMEFSLKVLGEHPGMRRIALLGEMLELGPESEGMHKKIAGKCINVDLVMTFGLGFANVSDAFGSCFQGHLNSFDEFDLSSFAGHTREGDVILVKGSNKVFWSRDFVDRLVSAIARL